jgi:hypothetical protein
MRRRWPSTCSVTRTPGTAQRERPCARALAVRGHRESSEPFNGC